MSKEEVSVMSDSRLESEYLAAYRMAYATPLTGDIVRTRNRLLQLYGEELKRRGLPIPPGGH